MKYINTSFVKSGSRNVQVFLLSIMIFIGILIISASCKKKINYTGYDTTSIGVLIYHNIDSNKVYFDSIMYTNAANNKYGIKLFNYYLSDFKLYKGDEEIYSSDLVSYIDATDVPSTMIILEKVPTSDYDSISFNIGLNSTVNVAGGLDSYVPREHMEIENGGYYFLKMEGDFKNGTTYSSFKLAVAQNENLITIGKKISHTVVSTKTTYIAMHMNINEWFNSPYKYDFTHDTLVNIYDTLSMKKLSKNGLNVFSISALQL